MNLEERLIVAADFDPNNYDSIDDCLSELEKFIEKIKDTGVIIKLNSILRRRGYRLIEKVHEYGLGCMADLKLDDIPKTIEIDCKFLNEFKPEILTIKCSAGEEGMYAAKSQLPDTCVVGVTVLTSFDKESCKNVYGNSDINSVVKRFFDLARDSGIDGIVCSPNECEIFSDKNMELITPGIRPKWYNDSKDDQKRVSTPGNAILNGASRVVIGRPITKSECPEAAIDRTLNEISSSICWEIDQLVRSQS